MLFKRTGSLFVLSAFQVLPTIHFNDETVFVAEEIDDVRINRKLASELGAH